MSVATTSGHRCASGAVSRSPLPDFLIIGAAKCGTTTLYRYLTGHPEVFMPAIKEPEFFSRDDLFVRGVAWYRSLFAEAEGDDVCGEASTTYTRWPHTPDASGRIARLLPNIKLIYIVRNPVDRAYSHYAHHMRAKVTMSLEHALTTSSIYIDCGLYMEQLERYLRFIPRSQVLVLLLDDLRDDPVGTMAEVQCFIGVVPCRLASTPLVENRSGAEYYLRTKLLDPLKRCPGVGRVLRATPKPLRDGVFGALRASPLGRAAERAYVLDPMRTDTRQRLIERFAEPNRRLGEFLGRDLSHWST